VGRHSSVPLFDSVCLARTCNHSQSQVRISAVAVHLTVDTSISNNKIFVEAARLSLNRHIVPREHTAAPPVVRAIEDAAHEE